MEINQLAGRTTASLPTQPAARSDVAAPAASAQPAVPYDAARVNQAEKAQKSAVSDEALQQSLNAINRFLKPVTGNIEFTQDQDTGRTLVKIVDTQTNTVLRQIPSEEAVAIAKELDKLQGLLVREKA
ncbi:flagellar protein FlaG [Noviherbaspirillum galbum]|uniref:Flagellar protein FlaG n=1 Tax=Noviherbaspirillum galbum TaxID=2709383 RepID=A0A6B3SUY2_9BURK|nr:flagellar protein FlaG [Noviherbaspirillum galbum]NEX62706.1 flagellar protein FlaG [Noviherbaspirillum galbum]